MKQIHLLLKPRSKYSAGMHYQNIVKNVKPKLKLLVFLNKVSAKRTIKNLK